MKTERFFLVGITKTGIKYFHAKVGPFLRRTTMMMVTLTVLLSILLQFALFHLSNADGEHPIQSYSQASPEPQPGAAIKTEFYKLRLTSQHEILRFYLNGQTNKNGPIRYYYYSTATNFMLVGELELEFISVSVNSPPVYPFPRKYGTGGRRPPTKRFPTGYGDMRKTGNGNNGKWRLNFLPVPDRSTYTPYIVTRALTNIPKFFDHLRENLDAILKSKQGKEGGKIAPPTRRSFASKSEKLSGTQCDPVLVPSSPTPAKANNAHDDRSRDRELRRFLHGKNDSDHPKANNYNPAWLFTNLGFGKRDNNIGRGSIEEN